jgi:hypothetical protein
MNKGTAKKKNNKYKHIPAMGKKTHDWPLTVK